MFSALYLAAIVAINFGFEHTSMVALPGGEVWPPMSLVVGLIFILRDYAQREIGQHKVLLLMLAGAALSYKIASPATAAASLVAYILSETLDWSVYTFARLSFRQRVALSSLISAPIDSFFFLWMLGLNSPAAVTIMTVSKWIGIAAVLTINTRRA